MTSPTTAVNTASNITRGFISATKADSRIVSGDCVSRYRRERGSAAISISVLLSATAWAVFMGSIMVALRLWRGSHGICSEIGRAPPTDVGKLQREDLAACATEILVRRNLMVW